MYTSNQQKIVNAIDKTKDLECKPCLDERGQWRDPSTEAIQNLFWPDIDPFYIRKNWTNMMEQSCRTIRHIYQDLDVKCFFCGPVNMCWGCKFDQRDGRKKIQKAKEVSPKLKQNDNYIRKRKPINFTMKDLEIEAEDDVDDDFEPTK